MGGVDRQRRLLLVEGENIPCTPKEFDLCRLLVDQLGQTVTRDQLVDVLWSGISRRTSMNNVVDVHLSRLRNKLKDSGAKVHIETVRGIGFRMEDHS